MPTPKRPTALTAASNLDSDRIELRSTKLVRTSDGTERLAQRAPRDAWCRACDTLIERGDWISWQLGSFVHVECLP